ncbi:uncharacterized protein TNCV_3862871 [Trichonephila clavipes]|uniref:Uncharacterized protein n=1 Tax=Trichonephila clavipes TaxID=2585209 RepID=A0A8X6S729_TRICX|nr:uncharacterized protein TNCV_3862871 [Trichonephila clavipes]
MRQARHLPQRWYWSIVLQVRDVIRQFTQGTPNCNTNPKATVFGIPKEPVLESAELITSRLTGAGSLLPPAYGEAWAKGHATGTPDSTFPRYGSPHTANMRSSFLVHGTTPNGGVDGRSDPKCPSARRLHMVREDTWAPDEGATCAWMAADEVVGCTRAFLTMRRSS